MPRNLCGAIVTDATPGLLPRGGGRFHRRRRDHPSPTHLPRSPGGKDRRLHHLRRRQAPAPAAGPARRQDLGYKGDDLCLLAATIEFLHTSTLLHDDVVDASGLRRGRSTANALWGNAPSVLVGDFLYARSFEMMVELGSMPVMRIISQATRVIAEGEVLQLSKVRDASTTEETYMEVIRGKTAMLFRPRPTAPPRCARPARNSPRHCAASATTWESPSSWWTTCSTTAATPRPRQNVGDDLAEGKPTLPLIVTMRDGTEEQAALVRKAIQQGGSQDLESVCAAVEAAGALDYTANLARDYAARAIACLDTLPDNEYRSALVELSEFAVARTH